MQTPLWVSLLLLLGVVQPAWCDTRAFKVVGWRWYFACYLECYLPPSGCPFVPRRVSLACVRCGAGMLGLGVTKAGQMALLTGSSHLHLGLSGHSFGGAGEGLLHAAQCGALCGALSCLPCMHPVPRAVHGHLLHTVSPTGVGGSPSARPG